MLVFISDYPSEENERDGMMQRVAAIDKIFHSVPRLYLYISFWRHRKQIVRSRGLVRVEHLNLLWHYKHILRCLKGASSVYVHSAWNALRVLPFLGRLRAKTIADVHGVVPEEMRFVGQPVLAVMLQMAERAMVRNASLLIFVTHRMAQHFTKKYPGDIDRTRIAILPNTHLRDGREEEPLQTKRAAGALQLIYAGGVQKWQNLDLVLRTLAQLATLRRNWRASICVPRVALREVQHEVDQSGCGSYVEVVSLTHDEVLAKYLSADAGFVLRTATLLNEVAMPTKLVEYLRYGVVPIVLSADIGDFPQYEYKYIRLADLFDEHKVNPVTLESMRVSNYRILASIDSLAEEGRRQLELCCGLMR
jgi:glycosyltransferase involved in cell wall biosynthesis